MRDWQAGAFIARWLRVHRGNGITDFRKKGQATGIEITSIAGSIIPAGTSTFSCVPPWALLTAFLLMGAHLILIVVQVVGSLWIKKLSPNWSTSGIVRRLPQASVPCIQ